jgi:t-SNARE complex subunit (syntaxin)
VASGALTADVSAEVERLQAQHADAVREKSAAESKSRRLAEKVAALEAEKTDLRRQLVEERREANQAIVEVQARGGQIGAGGGKSCQPTRRGMGGAVQRSARPRGDDRGLYALGS